MNKLIAIKTDASAIISLNVDETGNIATVQHSVKVDKLPKTPRFNLTWTFDFTKVGRKTLVELAVRSQAVLIKKQGTWRSAKNRMDADVWQNAMFEVMDMLAEGRQTATHEEKLAKEFNKMDRAEQLAMIAKLQAQVA